MAPLRPKIVVASTGVAIIQKIPGALSPPAVKIKKYDPATVVKKTRDANKIYFRVTP